MTQKILLDTDIGSDIDDAVALAYLLAQPECELLGITTVSGEVKNVPVLPAPCAVLLDVIFPSTQGEISLLWWSSGSWLPNRLAP